MFSGSEIQVVNTEQRDISLPFFLKERKLAAKYKGKTTPAVKITAYRVLINVTKETEEECVKGMERSCYRVVALPWVFKVQK
jgi:hypothetical protein